jgi:hypothetical protein
MCRMLSENTFERVGSILLCPKGCPTSNCPPLRFSRSCTCISNFVLTMTHPFKKKKVLKPACVNALKRIFKLCDTNKDGILDPSELNEFQVSRANSLPHLIYSQKNSENVSMPHCSFRSWKASERWSESMLMGAFETVV